MDKIFREIKNAIEEEMRNAESGPPPGGGRPQGGRRAQEYADWLKEEQERLRGSQQSQQEVYQPEELEEVPVEMPAEARRPQGRERSQRPRGNRQQQSQGQGSRRQQHEQQSSKRQSQRSQGGERSTERPVERAQRQQQQERRRQPQRPRASEPTAARDYRNRIERQLKSPGGLRMAFLMREIVSKPVSLRDQDEHLIS